MPKPQDKPFGIPKQMVWEAYRRVAANKGAAGVDEQSLEEFEADLGNNLYKVWNRMSSGTYFPPPVRAVEIPKPHGDGVRLLGVPTIADRIAQTVVAMHLEERTEPRFHRDSYGYRPKRSAHDALRVCRQRCWKHDWIIDLDVQKFFDTVPWDLIVKAVETATDAPWMLLYVKRWFAAPLQYPDGALVERDKGTPQGSAVSPVLANLFMHYAFDLWMARNYPGCPFERYADDAVVHCVSRKQARYVLAKIAARMEEVGLTLHPDKTRVVYCKDSDRRGGARAHLVHLPRVHLPGTGGAPQERVALHLVLARDQSRGAQGQKRQAPRDADTQTPQPLPGRPGEMAEPHRRRVDALLRPVLPVGVVSPPPARQHLPEALGREEIPGATDIQAVPTVVGRATATRARLVPPLEVGAHVLTSW